MSEESDYKIYDSCVKCKSTKITRQTISDYTGGGFADYYDEYECEECEYIWQIKFKSGYS